MSRNLTWFSYIGGEDIRDRCGPGASDSYRFVYNGIYRKQIRSYDLRMLPDGRSATLSAWARAVPDFARPIPVLELGRQWDGTRAEATLPVQGVGSLRAALEADGLRGDRPDVLRLPSNEFYWTAAACVDGRFLTNAWLYPSARFESLRFPGVLKTYDRTGVPFYEARPVNRRDDDPNLYDGDQSEFAPFHVQLGPKGFVGTDGLI
mgnify:CR=1 FL=1